MRRSLLAISVCVATTVAVVAPAAGAERSAAPASYARVAAPGGVLTMERLNATGVTRFPSSTWVPAGTMTQAIQENGGGAFLGGMFHVPGGFIEFTGPTLYDKMQILDPTTNTWVADPEPMPLPEALGLQGWADAAVCANPATGTVHVVNGVDGEFIYSAHQVYVPAAPAGSRWVFAPFPMLPDGTTFFSQASGCAWIGGKMYLFGGFGGFEGPGECCFPQATTWVFDPTTLAWADTGHLMKSPRFWHGYASMGPAAAAAGGVNNLTTFAPLAGAERYLTTTGWANLPSLPAGRLAPGMGIVSAGGTVYGTVFGGGTQNADGSFTLQNTTLACPVSGASCTGWFDSGFNLTAARWFHAFGSSGAQLYAAGGGVNPVSASTNTAEKAP